MSRIESIFHQLRSSGRRGLMPFVCGGHPSASVTERVLPALERAGASIIEVGIPFSDPIADGPVIAAAMHEALGKGVTPRAVMDAIGRARGSTNAGLVAMVSVSIIQRIGAERFVRDAAGAGFDGLIIPDVPVEESAALSELVRDAGLTMSLLVAPTTPPARAEKIARACSGFVYLLARVGITGDGGAGVDASAIAQRVAMLRAVTDLPIACGFGIASAEDVAAVVRPVEAGGAGADAAIVGSALVKRMTRAAMQGKDAADEAEAFCRGLALGLGR